MGQPGRQRETTLTPAAHPADEHWVPAMRAFTGQVAEALADRDAIAAAVEAKDASATSGRVQEVQKRADHRRLARTLGTEEAEDLTLLDLNRDLLDAPMAAVELRQPLSLDRRHETRIAGGASTPVWRAADGHRGHAEVTALGDQVNEGSRVEGCTSSAQGRV